MKQVIKIIKPEKRTVILVGLFVVVFGLGWLLGHQDARFGGTGIGRSLIGQGSTNQVADFNRFWRTWDLLVKNFDGKVDYEKMIDGAITGMTDSLGDPYTTYLNESEARALEDDLSGTISGIGAEIGIKNKMVVVISPIDDSPAKKAGIQAGDIISTINGETTEGMTIAQAVSKIRGEAGTVVKLTVNHNGEKKDYAITRAKFTVQNIKAEVKKGNIGYVSVGRFDENTDQDLKKELEQFKAKGITKVILDLRDNPGGYLDQAVDVASEFQGTGIIVSEKRTSTGDRQKIYKASPGGIFTSTDAKIVVLTNGGSASASEIVAGALKDHRRATLIGEKTFGKGSVQEIKNLSGGSQVKITVAHWFTPLGRNISKEGITPDINVPFGDADFNAGRDPQLDKALEFLNK